MEYLFLLLVGWVVVCLPALFYASIVDGRRRRDANEFTQRIATLTRQLESLERHLASPAHVPAIQPGQQPVTAAPQQVSPSPVPVPVAPQPRPAVPAVPPVIEISEKQAPAEAVPALPAQKPATPAEKPPSAEKPLPPIQPTAKEPVTAPLAPKPVMPEPRIVPAPEKPAAPIRTDSFPKPAVPPIPADAAARVQAPPPPAAPAPARPAAPASLGSANVPPPVAPPSVAQVSRPAAARFTSPELKRRSFSIEETLGANWLPRVGITFIVLGAAWFVGAQWSNFAPWLRLLIVYASGFGAGLGFLAGGVFLEKKEQQRILGRCLIGGGWAITTLMTYVLSHGPFAVLSSQRLDLVLLLAVIGMMVWHTLRYNSQLVTGAAFLLGFTAIALNPDPPFNLIAGALLISGMIVIVLRRQWYELEVFGILAAYLNHFYWLFSDVFTKYQIGRPFPQYGSSLALLVTYWAVFRASYLLRKISGANQERVSTIAGLLNPLLFMGLVKSQSFHPEWTFAALLSMGAAEFILGQLPAARRRIQPFYVLSSFGALLMVAAFPVKYSGDALELIWLTGAEAFLIAGILTRERLFRGFGLIISSLVAMYAMPVRVLPLTDLISSGRPHHDAQLGLVLGIIALVLYVDAHVAGRVWKQLFASSPEAEVLTGLSFAAALFCVFAAFATFTDNVVAIVLAVFLTALSWAGRRFSIPALIFETHGIAAVAFVQVIAAGMHADARWSGIPQRVVMFGVVAGCLYLSSRFVRFAQTQNGYAFAYAYAAAASSLVSVLIWQQAPAWSVIVLWILFGLVLACAGQYFKRIDFKWQALALVLVGVARAFAVNFSLTATTHHVSYRLISVGLAAAGAYLLGRWSPMATLRPIYSVSGTLLLTWLGFLEPPQPWSPVAWISLALLLGFAARRWNDKALEWQTHFLSVLAVGWTFANNFGPQYRATHAQLISVAIVCGAVYALSWIKNTRAIASLSYAYAAAASSLAAVLIWQQAPSWSVIVLWVLFGLVLVAVAEFFHRADFKWQALALVIASAVRAFIVNFELTATTHHVSYRLISICVTAAGIYLLGRWSPMAAVRPIYSLAGTLLLSWLAYVEAPQPWTPVAWIGLALLLGVAARLLEDKALLWQTHLLSLLAAVWTFVFSFGEQYRGTRVQLISVAITTVSLYALTWITNIAAIVDDERICQCYSWGGSLLVSWLAWYQLDPVFVSMAWCLLGFMLFEAPDTKWFSPLSRTNMRAQAYVALVSSFAHVFYSNFNTPVMGNLLQVLSDVRVLAILPLPPVFYWVYWRLHSEEQRGGEIKAAAGAASV